MKALTLFTFIFLIILPKIKAQELISPYGGSATTTSMIIDYSLGEPAISSKSLDHRNFKEGLLQPRILVRALFTETRNANGKEFELQISPNPTTSTCEIKFIQPLETDARLTVHNLQSELIHNELILSNTEIYTLELTNLPAGIYVLSLFDQDKKIQFSYRIIKVH